MSSLVRGRVGKEGAVGLCRSAPDAPDPLRFQVALAVPLGCSSLEIMGRNQTAARDPPYACVSVRLPRNYSSRIKTSRNSTFMRGPT